MQSGPVLLPEINAPFCFSWKTSRKVSGKALSHFHLEDEAGSPILDFEIEHNPQKGYPHGSFCKWVKKGFPLPAGEKFAVKKYDLEHPHALKMAMRAAAFYKVIGERAIPFIDDHGVYLLMKYYEGNSLGDLHEQGRAALIPINYRLKYMADVLHQLAMMHEQDCIHRDVKPDNIIFTNSSAHLVDFDAAFMLGELRRVQSCTLGFLSKENQSILATYEPDAATNAHMFNRKSDLHALCLTLYVLFSDLFDLKNYEGDVTLGVICERSATKNDKALQHSELTDFIHSLEESKSHQYASTREIFATFIRLCLSVYKEDFSARYSSNALIKKDSLRSILDNIGKVLKGYEDKFNAYCSTPTYYRRRLNQPKAIFTLEAWCVPGMEKLLATFDPADYSNVFENILRPVKSLAALGQALDLYHRTLPLIAAEHKDKFISGYRQAFIVKQATRALKIELEGEPDLARQLDMILSYVDLNRVDVSELAGPHLFPFVAKLPIDMLDKILSFALKKIPSHDFRAKIDAGLKLVLQSHQMAPDMTMRLFHIYLYPLCEHIPLQYPGIELLENCLNPATEEDVLAIAQFYSHLDKVAVITHKMHLHFPAAAELRVRVAYVLLPNQCVEFYQHNIVSSDINADNIIPLMARLPAEHRLDFLLKHVEDPTVDAVQAQLTNDEVNFLLAREQIIAKLNSYKSEKVNLHDKRVVYIYQQVCNARTVGELGDILNVNSFGCLSAQAHQYANHPPGNRLFSYGFARLMKACQAVIAQPVHQAFGFYFL